MEHDEKGSEKRKREHMPSPCLHRKTLNFKKLCALSEEMKVIITRDAWAHDARAREGGRKTYFFAGQTQAIAGDRARRKKEA